MQHPVVILSIYTPSGQEVLQRRLVADNRVIPWTPPASGSYIYQLRMPEGQRITAGQWVVQ